MWSRRRTAGEAVLAVVMALLAAGTEELLGGEGWQLAGVALAAAVLSLLRRRLPATVLVGTGALAPLVPGFGVLLILVGWSAGRYVAGAGRALVVFTVAYVLNLATALLESWDQHRVLSLALLSTLYYLATTLAPGLANRYWTQRRTLLHALQERNAQLLRERAMVAGQARLRERQRIAQDMHDSLGHQLALISVHTGALEVDRELTDRQREAVGVLRNASVTAMHELREVVGILRDGVEAPVEAPQAAARAGDESGRAARGTAGIEGLVDAARAAGNQVELRRIGERRPLPPAADHAAYRIVQEALTNAYKHAPGALIGVELRYEPDSFVVEIVNEAPEAAPRDVVSGGQGLTGLHERARLVGGMVHAGPSDDGGFRVAGVLPYGVVEASPLVDAADDFRQQSTTPLRGHGGPVAVGPADWTFTERELAMAIRGGGRSRSGGVALGCGIGFAALVLLMVAAGFGLYFMVGSMKEGMIDPAQYDAVKVGTAEREVRDQLPSGDTVTTTGLHGKGPAEPAGSKCLVLMSSEIADGFEMEPVFRFCFKDGKLIEKKSYEVKR
ncbi:sensor histidine kinase [Streptomyces sp. ISL-36]|uniref:sensor histidine kinase n=1 Tax=Streptomyces sp. ISL-36 TaxID=2819182 RepID=UPI001BE66DB2|nr:histidine kinase [Streptomyces sp. ISL-36]MBT2444794.1 sensor histidine kinase [Streptomyces sp. ISL-36]